jgi:L,D-transpeptidase catalytic domain/Bacterial Ig-like domain
VFGVRRPVQQPGSEGSADGDSAGSTGSAEGPAAKNKSGSPAPGAKPDQAAAADDNGGGGSSKPRTSTSGRPGFPGLRVVAIGTAAAAAIAAGIVYAVTQGSQPSPAAQAAARPIHVVALSPANQASAVDGANPIIVTFSGQLSPNSAMPKLTPSVPGSWTVTGDSLEFVPTTPFSQSTLVTVEIPGGSSGVRSTDGGILSGPLKEQFTTGSYSQAGLAILLTQLGYLPMTWVPQRTDPTMAELATDPAAQTPEGEAYDPPAGSYSWDTGYPASLEDQWSPDQANVLLQGAVMAFKSEHNMTIDGSLTPQLWTALFQAVQLNQQNTNGYTYAVANKGSPETLTIWHNGQQVLQSLANTGIGVAPTVDGTFPVYERFLNTIMSGTNPDGSHYSDPVQFVSYFNGGDAVHYFARGSYGYPQSLGCVELPYTQAEQAYPYLTYGSLVTVQG